MPSRRPARLYAGADAGGVLVSARPLRVRAGRAVSRRYGTLVHVVPRRPSGRAPMTVALPLGAVLAALLFVLTALGLALVAAGVGAVVAAVALRGHARAASECVLELRGGDGHVLAHPADRETMLRCLELAQRIRGTWPALRHMIDPGLADPQLTRALADLAGVLARRQEIRRVRDELAAVRATGLAADSPAVRALGEQRRQVGALWREVDAEVEQHATRLRATAVAGERLAREERVGAAARAAGHAVARLSAGRAPAFTVPGDPAGQELAERTAAVVGAYRDLADRYGA